jgi:hypothetical protein
MPHVAWLALGTVFAVAAVASFIAGYAGTAIGMIAISLVFDGLYILAVRDRRKSGDASPKR